MTAFLKRVLRQLSAWVQRLRRISGPLSDLRITIILLVAGATVILALPQGRDVVRGLTDDANVFIDGSWPTLGSTASLFQWAAFLLACVWTGVNAWYWSNILYKSDRRTPQPHWFKIFRRFIGLLPLLCAMAAMIVSSHRGLRDVWIGFASFGVATLVLYGFFASRTALFGRFSARRARRYNNGSYFGSLGTTRTSGLVRGDDWFIVTTIFISFLFLALFSIPEVRTDLAWSIGSAAIAFGAIGCIIPVTSAVIWVSRAYRLPIVLIALVMAAVFSLFNDNHTVRALTRRPAHPAFDRIAARPTVDEALDAWQVANADGGPLVLVAAAGGASRASYWTATVLQALDDNTDGYFSRRIFAISGVSGGSLGAVGYAAWLADHVSRPTVEAQARRRFVQTFFGKDYLTPAVAGMLFPDLFQRFLPAPILPSRANSLEEAWEMGWSSAVNDCIAEFGAARCGDEQRMKQDFLEIWRRQERPGVWVPFVFVNGTHVETGKRVIAAPVKIDPTVFEDTFDFFALAKHPVRASTAILTSARFPIISPAGTLRFQNHVGGHLIDGGYFENAGLETVTDLALYIRRTRPQIEVIVVELDNDDRRRSPDSARHSRASGDGALRVGYTEGYSRSPFLGEVTSIVGGLYQTRTARATLSAKRLSRPSDDGSPAYYQFRLGEIVPGRGTAMSWSLSLSSRDAMDVVFNVDADEVPRLLAGRRYTDVRRHVLEEELADVIEQPQTLRNRAELQSLAIAIRARAPTSIVAKGLVPAQ